MAAVTDAYTTSRCLNHVKSYSPKQLLSKGILDSVFSSRVLSTLPDLDARSDLSSQNTAEVRNKTEDRRDRALLLAETIRIVNALRGDTGDLDTRVESGKTSLLRRTDVDQLMQAWVEHAISSDSPDLGLEAANHSYTLLKAMNASLLNRNETQQTRSLGQEKAISLSPNIVSYNHVLQAYAASGGGVQAAERAEAILKDLLTRCREYMRDPREIDSIPPEPNSQTFNICMNAWAKSGDEDSGRRAEKIFIDMEEWHEECSDKECPFDGAVSTARSLAAVMDAWARSGVFGADERVLAILDHAIETYRRQQQAIQTGGAEVKGTVIKPNVVLFNIAIYALVNSDGGNVAAEKAEELLRRLESLNGTMEFGFRSENDEDEAGLEPNTRTMALVLDAWARCENAERTGEAAQHAQDVLDRMEALHREGKNVKPNYVAFTTCMNAWSRSRVRDAAERSEALLSRMIALYRETGDGDFKPTPISANAVISAWAKSNHPNATERAEAALRQLEEFCQPTVGCFSSVLSAHAKKGNVRAAQNILNQMESGESNAPSPDTATYNAVLDALAKTRRRESAVEAERLLAKMEIMSRQERSVCPNSISYTSVIDAWSRSSDKSRAEKSHAVFTRMLHRFRAGDKNSKPDVFACTAFITACANSTDGNASQKRNALKMSIRMFEEMKGSADYENPNGMTYLAIMKACLRLASNRVERIRLLERLFRQCFQDGCVSKLVLALFQRSVPKTVQAKFYSVADERPEIPLPWKANIRVRNQP